MNLASMMVFLCAANPVPQDSGKKAFQPLAGRDARILVVGLENSRRADFLAKVHLGPTAAADDPAGFRVDTVKFDGISLVSFDLKEGTGERALASPQTENVNAIIFIVDSADRERLTGKDGKGFSARSELGALLKSARLSRSALLVFADQQEKADALPAKDVAEALDLGALRGRPWYIQACAVSTGDGLYEGLDWLIAALVKALREVPPDVDAESPIAPVVERVLRTGLMTAVDGRFRGGLSVSRYDVARTAARLLVIGGVKGPLPGPAPQVFQDVPPDHPALADVMFAVQCEVLDGYEGKFHGDKRINRYQISVVMKRIFQRVGYKLNPSPDVPPFPDLAAKHWAFESLALTYAEGLTPPYPDGLYHGYELVDRLQLAGISYRAADKLGWKNLPAPVPMPPVSLELELKALERDLADLLGKAEALKARIAELRARPPTK